MLLFLVLLSAFPAWSQSDMGDEDGAVETSEEYPVPASADEEPVVDYSDDE